MDPVRRSIERGAMTATLADLESRNALGAAPVQGLREAVAAAKADPEEAFRWTSRLSGELFAGDEAAEGVKAFLARRPPAWARSD